MSCFSNITGNTALRNMSTLSNMNSNLVISRFVFNPPKNPTYFIIKKLPKCETPKNKSEIVQICSINKNKEIPKIYEKNSINQFIFHSPYFPNLSSVYRNIELTSYIVKKKDKNSYLSVLYIENTAFNQNTYRIVYSHGSSSDLGTNLSFLYNLSLLFKCDVISYDYTGYGCSTGTPSEKEMRTDLQTVLNFLKNDLEIPLTSIILYGYSIGSVPTIKEGGSKSYGKYILGVMLLSPLVKEMSSYFFSEGIQKKPKKMKDGNQKESNFELIKEIIKPVFLVHGKEDPLVSINEVEEMSVNVINLYKWYPRKGDHTNIAAIYRAKFFTKAKDFIQFTVERFKEELSKRNRNNLLDSSRLLHKIKPQNLSGLSSDDGILFSERTTSKNTVDGDEEAKKDYSEEEKKEE